MSVRNPAHYRTLLTPDQFAHIEALIKEQIPTPRLHSVKGEEDTYMVVLIKQPKAPPNPPRNPYTGQKKWPKNNKKLARFEYRYRFELDEILPLITETDRWAPLMTPAGEIYGKVGGYRLHTLLQSQKCVKCGRVGTYFMLEQYPKEQGNHINLYTDDGVMMTVDHIHPRSLGGSDKPENLQTMCGPCNWKKGNKINGTSGSKEISA